MITALFALAAFVLSGAWAQTPTTPSTVSLVPRTLIVTMIVQGVKDDPVRAPETLRACAFAAQHAENIGHVVADYCGGASEKANAILPQAGDPVIFLVFASSPVDPGTLQRALPPQAAGMESGTSTVALLPVPFAEGGDTAQLVGGEHRTLSAAVEFPGNDPGLVARSVVRCLFAAETTGGMTFEEAMTCLNRLSEEENPKQYLRIYGGWDSFFNSAKLIYPPRVEPVESATTRTARALRKYDEQRRKQKPPPLAEVPEEAPVVTAEPPPLTPPASIEPLPTSPLPTKRKPLGKWSTGKIVLTTAGAATTVATGIAIVTVYSEASTLAEDITAGEYGVAGDSRLTTAVEEYNRLGSTLPWLWAGVGTGTALVGVGVALPVPKDSTVEAMVSMGPSGLMFTGTF